MPWWFGCEVKIPLKDKVGVMEKIPRCHQKPFPLSPQRSPRLLQHCMKGKQHIGAMKHRGQILLGAVNRMASRFVAGIVESCKKEWESQFSPRGVTRVGEATLCLPKDGNKKMGFVCFVSCALLDPSKDLRKSISCQHHRRQDSQSVCSGQCIL